MRTVEQLKSKIRDAYLLLDETGVIAISPVDLADTVYKQIDPEELSPDLVEIAAILHLRQIAREVCRARQVEGESDSEQGSLFDFQLQQRYPAERSLDGKQENFYVLRGHLTFRDRARNIQRLRHEANAKVVHADALEAETDALVRAGALAREESHAEENIGV